MLTESKEDGKQASLKTLILMVLCTYLLIQKQVELT